MRLDTERRAMAATLQAQLAIMQTQIDGNTIAIDNVLLDLVTINAGLTVINSNILSLQMALSSLEADQAANTQAIIDLSGIVSTLESDVTDLQALHGGELFGIQTDFPEADLTSAGWSRCYSTPYNTRTSLSTMLNQCSGAKIAIACKAINSSTVTLAASANREDVFFDTGNGRNAVHNANGVDWYYSTGWSMGFAPQGLGVNRYSADTLQTQAEKRLSWHTSAGSHSAGYRCGTLYPYGNLNFEKVVYQAD